MEYMARYGLLRARPHELLPGTRSVISVRLNYLPPVARIGEVLGNPDKAYISRYALGRDYHKVLRNQLKKLGDRINAELGSLQYRPFVDSAPVMERPLADKAGLGWTGKHTLLLHPQAGSFFFLGELLVDLPLPTDTPIAPSCGQCSACLQICPTKAIVAPYQLDARRCISYLTIELDGPIPEEFRKLIGNRIYGCDDCQLICPWNRYALTSPLADFAARPVLHAPDLLTLWQWNEATFLKQTEGSAIRRIGHEKWLRNIAVALGNAPANPLIITALRQRRDDVSPLVQTHIDWALQQQRMGIPISSSSEESIDVSHDLSSTPTNNTADQQISVSVQKKKERLLRCIEKGLPADIK